MVSIVFKNGLAQILNDTFQTTGRERLDYTVTDGKSATWGTFKVGDTLTIEGRRLNQDSVFSTQEATFLGTHVRTGMGTEAERTYLVFTFVDSFYSVTRYLLVGPHPGGTLDLATQFNEVGDNISENYFIPCFLPGTLIATPNGERRIEELAAGDIILSISGGGENLPIPVKWIGRRVVSTFFGPAERLMPVRFAAGSLGDGIPHTDLTVTADHAILVDGVLCQAETLVNGTTVTRVPLSEYGEKFTVYHLETERHEILLANGAPAETFIDNASRRAFDNYAEFEVLYGANPPEMVELPHPRACNARHLPARIRTRFGIAGADHAGKVALESFPAFQVLLSGLSGWRTWRRKSRFPDAIGKEGRRSGR